MTSVVSRKLLHCSRVFRAAKHINGPHLLIKRFIHHPKSRTRHTFSIKPSMLCTRHRLLTNGYPPLLATMSIGRVRHFSSTSTPNAMKFSDLKIERSTQPKDIPPNHELEFGKSFSDHMLELNWNIETGWEQPLIRPFQDFSLSPSSSVFHYGLAAFEGMKAYHDASDNIRLFRPQMNMQRLQSSCKALAFPAFDENEFVQCMQQLLREDKRWIPSEKGYSLYIRPTVIATTPQVKVIPAQDIKLYVITCPVGPYYSGGFNAIKLLATDKHVRAWPGGSGAYKLGSNYGPTIKPQADASHDGYSQILWLFPRDNKLYVGEVGSMNLFFFWINKSGQKELITAPLDGTILPGITRNSILSLTRHWNEFVVTEREFTMDEVLDALKEKRVLECFGAGTAAIVAPVYGVGFQGVEYEFPLDPSNTDAKIGPLAQRLFHSILDIQYGEGDSPSNEDPWSIIVPAK